MIINNLVFEKKSILPPFTKDWVLENASISGTSLVLAPKTGRARLYLTSPVRTDFKHYKVSTEFQSTIADELWNYRSVPSIQIEEGYADETGAINSVNFRALAFNITNPTAETHKDDTYIETLNRPLHYMRFIILNNSDAPLTINTVSLFLSIDVSEKQVSKIYAQATSNASAKQINQYFNPQGIMTGIGFVVNGGNQEMKMKFNYFNGKLISINTNYGQTVSVFSIVGNIDLTNTDLGYDPNQPPNPPT